MKKRWFSYFNIIVLTAALTLSVGSTPSGLAAGLPPGMAKRFSTASQLPLSIGSPASSLENGSYQWHTFYGSTYFDESGSDIAVDGSGGVYITGSSHASWNGPAGQAPLHAYSGNEEDIVVLKLGAAGEYQWHTFYGSAVRDEGSDIVVDGSGGVYITGTSLASWNGPADQPPLHTYSDSLSNIITLKLDAAGAYQWHTFYGGWCDYGGGIAVDDSGGIYLTGNSSASWNGPAGQAPLHAYSGADEMSTDILVLKLDAAGDYQWHTFYGSMDFYNDIGRAVTVDSSGGVYVTGYSGSSWDGSAGQAPLHAHSGGEELGDDIVVLKLDAAGDYQWHTFYGSILYEYGYGIAVAGSAGVYITGASIASWSGPAGQAPLHAHSSSYNDDDIVVLKLDAAGAYLWHTFYGSTTRDIGIGIAVDGSGGVYIGGNSGLSWNGPAGQAPLHAFNDTNDLVVLELDTAGAYRWHTFYGRTDRGGGIALDGSGGIYITGSNWASWNGPADQPPLHYRSGVSNYDIVVLKLGEAHTPVVGVQDELGNPVSGAQVFRNGLLAGKTDSTGALEIPGLQVNETLVARLLIIEVATGKGNHNWDSSQNWAYRVYLTSLDIPTLGEPAPLAVTDITNIPPLVIKKSNTLIGFNLVASVQWDITSGEFADPLKLSFEDGSNLLYDATDGQMLLEKVTLYDEGQHWSDADYLYPVVMNFTFPAYADGMDVIRTAGKTVKHSWSDLNTWEGFNVVHEFGHYGLGIEDSHSRKINVFGKIDQLAECTSRALPTVTKNINATIMEGIASTSEFAMQGVPGLWSQKCEDTLQWQNNHESDWETLIRKYQDTTNPSRWEFISPGDRGSVVSGPENIPVAAWSDIVIGADAQTHACETEPVYIAKDGLFQQPVQGAAVWLKRTNRTIFEGYTDADGEIKIVGAGNGDTIVISRWRIFEAPDLWINSARISCTPRDMVEDAGSLASNGAATLLLQQAPFNLETSVHPGLQANSVEIVVQSSAPLSSSPAVTVTQSGAVTPMVVEMIYDNTAMAYTGIFTMSTALPTDGFVEVLATDEAKRNVQIENSFSLRAVSASQEASIFSGDGQVELFIPSGSLSVDSQITINPAQMTGEPPEGLVFLSAPHQIVGNVSFNIPINLMASAGSLQNVKLSSVKIYRWQEDLGEWVALESTIFTISKQAHTMIDSLGTFAVFGYPEYTTYLPLLR